jgi:Uma2 family endonuclease
MIATIETTLTAPITAEAYLEMQRSGPRESAPKYELINQNLILMAGASRNHVKINTNLTYLFGHQVRLHDLDHEVYANDMRVVSHVETKNYFYPDVVVVEKKPYFEDDIHQDTLMNPTIVVEILSHSTEAIDRGDKFKSYRLTKSVKEYILVNQYTAHIEHYYRGDDKRWQLDDYTEGVIVLKTLPFELKIEDIYFKVDFKDPIASQDPAPVS